jgi:hypothetical protein
MLRLLAEPTEELRRFRASPWQFQRSFVTPLKDLKRFVSTILEPYTFDRAVLTTDDVVFKPDNVLKLFESHSITVKDYYDNFTVEAESPVEITELLEAVLGNWIDFLFVPIPQQFAIYADHDEYTTFYLPKHSNLNDFSIRLREAGFKAVENYTRASSGDSWR